MLKIHKNTPVPGKSCVGKHVQSRKCNQTKLPLLGSTSISDARQNLPEFVWGSWSDWNEWGVCSCPANQRRRWGSISMRAPESSGSYARIEHCNLQWFSSKAQFSLTRDIYSKSHLPLPFIHLETRHQHLNGCWEWFDMHYRTRHCVGWECSGCGVEYGACERRCVTERWWSDWSEWIGGRFPEHLQLVTLCYLTYCLIVAQGSS